MATRKHGTLVASTVATIELAGHARRIEVVNRGTDDIFARGDGSDPTDGGGDDDYVVLPGGATTVPCMDTDNDGDMQIRLISVGATKYSIELL